MDYTWKLTEKMHVVAIADLFNVFDERAVNFYQHGPRSITNQVRRIRTS